LICFGLIGLFGLFGLFVFEPSLDGLAIRTKMESDAEPTAVLAHMLLGSRAHARDRELLHRLGVTHILNVSVVAGLSGSHGVRNQRMNSPIHSHDA
jgi:hypothetical protein